MDNAYSKVMNKTLNELITKYDLRKRRFDYLLKKYDSCIKFNKEQAEAYKMRLDHHENKLTEEISRIIQLKETLQKK